MITSRTSPAALYVALTRGREANLAHIATTATVSDPAQGRANDALHRDPLAAVLSGILAEDRHERRHPLRARHRHRVRGGRPRRRRRRGPAD